MLRSKPDVKSSIKFIKEVKQLCQKGGFNLTKFVTNSNKVLQSIANQDKTLVKDAPLENGKIQEKERALGVLWNLKDDTFDHCLDLKEGQSTRRGILSTISSIYDPLGFVSPFILKGRILLQKLCEMKYGWDDPLPSTVVTPWTNWKVSMSTLKNVKFRRCFKPSTFGVVSEISLHHFSDASEDGYGQASYLRLVDDNNNISCSLIIGKSRVSPIKYVSIPRLELTAAVLSVKIASLISKEIDMPEVKHYFWTDSKVVLSYLQSTTKIFKTFVANRVQQIKSSSNINDWNYVKSANNPADVSSRGLDPDERSRIDLWFNGPSFLLQPRETWEHHEVVLDINDGDTEIKKVNVIESKQPNCFLRLIHNSSSWQRMRRVVAFVVKATERMSRSVKMVNLDVTVEELKRAGQLLVKIVQRDQFASELASLTSGKTISLKSNIVKLNPFIDQDGIIRVGGRLRNSHFEIELVHPVLLPKHNHMSDAIIRWCHKRVAHGGRSSTINEVRTQGYWIVSVTSNVKRILHNCVICRRLRGRVGEQIMGDLPKDRTMNAPPFTYCGVDYFGPFIVKERRKELKRYGVIFTCFNCRAVHLETATSLDADTFIMALRRFISRRGNIRTIRSDNGRNFVGAENELRDALKEMDNVKIGQFLGELGADWEWSFNPPASSHMGGVWERHIRSIRKILSALLKTHGRSLDDEALRTLMTETEGILNSRPLTTDAMNDVNSPVGLSPINLLTMKSKVILPPPGKFSSADTYSKKRWRRVQHISNEFWSRRRTEYLQQLQERKRWNKSRRNLMIGDVVLLKEQALSTYETIGKWQKSYERFLEMMVMYDAWTFTLVVRKQL